VLFDPFAGGADSAAPAFFKALPERTMNRQAAVAVVLIVSIGFAFYANVHRFEETKGAVPYLPGEKTLRLLDDKHQQLKEQLPEYGMVGYTHDLKKWQPDPPVVTSIVGLAAAPGRAGPFSAASASIAGRTEKCWVNDQAKWNENIQMFLMTQYAFAPLVIVQGVDHPLVIGYFKKPAGEPQMEEGLNLVRDLGNGFKLYRREGR
jgi:hypothetical protein